MLVNDGNAGFTRILPTSLVVGTARSRTDRANHNNIRVGGLDRVEDLLEAVPEHVIDEIFVADAQIFKVERFRMTHGGTLGTPFGSHVTDGVLYGIHAIIQIVSYLTLR